LSEIQGYCEPNTALTSLKTQIQYFSFAGDLPAADEQDMVKLFFQPTLSCSATT
jgi:hypothetical protein